jgi:CRISPR-associated protein Cmr6
MKLPLPSDTRLILESNNVLSKTSNLGLLFNKYVSSWQNGWQMKEEDSKKFRQSIANMTFAIEHIANLALRQQAMMKSLKDSGWHVESFNAITDSRLIIGLGGTSVIETGMTLHPLYGFPYLPGSGLKGIARAYAEIAEVASKEELHVIFGSENKKAPAADNIQGRVFFMDGLPTKFPQLDLDIMNPHYSEYYQGNKPPADYLNPVPVTFLTVAAGQPFSFAVFSRHEDLAKKTKQWLIDGLTDLGAGGKTNVGYGYFKIERQEVQTQILNVYERKEETSITARLKLVKNEQTFGDFVKSIKSDEIESLRSSTFKGMESAINIGLTTVLESAEVSPNIKRIIAEKMLEVCKKPDKKYKEKLEKYNRLFSLARKDT